LVRQELVDTFCRQAEAMGATTLRVADTQEMIKQILEFLQPRGKRVAIAISPFLEEINLGAILKEAGFEVETGGQGFAREADTGMVEFDLGIAETGTLVHDATDLCKRLASMLPLNCIAVLSAKRIVPDMAQALEFYLEHGPWPGYLAFVTGPSRTADIERSLTIGVHGPENLLIVILEGKASKEGGGNNARGSV